MRSQLFNFFVSTFIKKTNCNQADKITLATTRLEDKTHKKGTRLDRILNELDVNNI